MQSPTFRFCAVVGFTPVTLQVARDVQLSQFNHRKYSHRSPPVNATNNTQI